MVSWNDHYADLTNQRRANEVSCAIKMVLLVLLGVILGAAIFAPERQLGGVEADDHKPAQTPHGG